jgi:DNA-binding NtrC family response regulator
MEAMDTEKILEGKRILVVDDEKDVLKIVEDILAMCKIDTAETYEQAKALMEEAYYDLVVLDIMGVRGYELLKIANQHEFPALMLTAHALRSEDLKHSAGDGAAYFAPKSKILDLPKFVADVLDAIHRKKSPWEKMIERLGSYYDKLFKGLDWREKENDYWDRKMAQKL